MCIICKMYCIYIYISFFWYQTLNHKYINIKYEVYIYNEYHGLQDRFGLLCISTYPSTMSFPIKDGFKRKSSLKTSQKKVGHSWNPETLQRKIARVVPFKVVFTAISACRPVANKKEGITRDFRITQFII